MDELDYISMLGRRQGKTYAICYAAKVIGATVIVYSQEEAKRIKKEYGVKAVSLDTNFRGTEGPYLVDTHAVSVYAQRKSDEIRSLQQRLKEAEAKLEKIKRVLE